MQILFVTTSYDSVVSICKKIDVEATVVDDFEKALEMITSRPFHYIFVDLDDESLKALQLLEWLSTCHLFAKTGVLTAKTYKGDFLRALRLGITEFLTFKEIEDEGLLTEALTSLKQKWQSHYSSGFYEFSDACWIRRSPATYSLCDQVRSLAKTPGSFLISGEEGGGKAYVARLLEHESDLDFLNFNLSEIEDFEQKNVILDRLNVMMEKGNDFGICFNDIEYLGLDLQEIVVELLKDHNLNLRKTVYLHNIQVVATSSANLDFLVRQEKFREDLYLILSQNEMHVPPLRDRREDIEILVEYYTKKYSDKFLYYSQDAMEALIYYDWPGNVGELKQVIKEIVCDSDGMVDSRKLPQKILQKSFYKEELSDSLADYPYHEAKKMVLNNFNMSYIDDVLKKSDGNLTVAAERAGMDRSNFKKIIKRYGDI